MTISTKDLNAGLDSDGTGKKAVAIKQTQPTSTETLFYVLGGVDYVGKAKWCETTSANTTAQQVSVVRSLMAA